MEGDVSEGLGHFFCRPLFLEWESYILTYMLNAFAVNTRFLTYVYVFYVPSSALLFELVTNATK